MKPRADKLAIGGDLFAGLGSTFLFSRRPQWLFLAHRPWLTGAALVGGVLAHDSWAKHYIAHDDAGLNAYRTSMVYQHVRAAFLLGLRVMLEVRPVVTDVLAIE